MRPWKLAECNYAWVKEQQYEVAVLPLGATEPHNFHLPYATDNLEADLVGEKICEEAHGRGARVVLLPTLPYGTQTNQQAFPLAMNLNPATLGAVITDLVDTLVRCEIRKIVLLNSHGGNDLKSLLRELYGKSPASMFLCNWYEVCHDIYHEIFEKPDNHAGEMETSLILSCRPDLVARDGAGRLTADDGEPYECRFDAVRRGWVTITRPWHLLTKNTGCGNPHAATAQKGEELLERLVERLGTFLVDLSESPMDERFPF